jgi:hypothetical protein
MFKHFRLRPSCKRYFTPTRECADDRHTLTSNGCREIWFLLSAVVHCASCSGLIHCRFQRPILCSPFSGARENILY